MIRRVLRSWKKRAELIREYLYDYRRMVRCSSAVRRDQSREKMRAVMTMYYHTLEKGLSIPRPRPGFGQDVVVALMRMLAIYVRQYGADSVVAVALNVLRAYFAFQRNGGMMDHDLREKMAELTRLAPESPEMECDLTGGCRTLTKKDLLEAARAPFERFSQLRHSVRQFSDENVDLEAVRHAIQMAQKTPSVCNRQSWRVWVVKESDKIAEILRIGGGARGFEDQMKMLLVVTSDLAYFCSSGERNQCWIDGGMFGMSLIYALHAQGLASCCMNWSKTRKDDRCLKRLMGIPDSESIIFLLGVGCPREEFLVAASSRRPVSDVIRYWGEVT